MVSTSFLLNVAASVPTGIMTLKIAVVAGWLEKCLQIMIDHCLVFCILKMGGVGGPQELSYGGKWQSGLHMYLKTHWLISDFSSPQPSSLIIVDLTTLVLFPFHLCHCIPSWRQEIKGKEKQAVKYKRSSVINVSVFWLQCVWPGPVVLRELFAHI